MLMLTNPEDRGKTLGWGRGDCDSWSLDWRRVEGMCGGVLGDMISGIDRIARTRLLGEYGKKDPSVRVGSGFTHRTLVKVVRLIELFVIFGGKTVLLETGL